MAGNVPSLEGGFEYQWMYGWYRVLALLSPSGRVETVTIEDPEAGLFDDVTVRPRAGTEHAAEFVQVKFHVDLSKFYSASSEDWLTLLRKAWRTWQKLRTEFPRLELLLVTTWSWDPTDKVRIGDQRLAADFIDGSSTDRDTQAKREAWRALLDQPDEKDFRPFLRSLRFRVGYDEKSELLERTRERMARYGLREDEDAVRIGADIVRQWVLDRHVRITRDDLDAAIDARGLREVEPDPAVTLYVHTIRKAPGEVEAEYELDWRDAFAGTDRERGHRLIEPRDWNARLFPELEHKATQIESETAARLLRVRGLARLSPWFAVGFVFRETTGWTIEADQHGARWRTDAVPSDDAPAVSEEALDGDANVVALSIGVSGDPTPDVRRYLESQDAPAGRMVIVHSTRIGRDSIRSDSDLARLAVTVKDALQALQPRARRLLVFYQGPAAGAVFIGHALNAAAGEIQLHEEDVGLYTPSFTLGAVSS